MSSVWLQSKRRTVTSQFGEDGVLEAIFAVIGTANKWCCEFGAWDGIHGSNCYNFLHNHGWRGVLIEADKQRARALAENQNKIGDFIAIEAFVQTSGVDTLDNLLARTPIPEDFDLLSIDIDNDDYYVWKSLKCYRPRVVVIEINSRYSPDVDKVPIPGYHAFTFRAGASVKSMVELAKSLGYELAAHTANGIFVRRDLADLLNVDRENWQEVFQWIRLSTRQKLRMAVGDIARNLRCRF